MQSHDLPDAPFGMISPRSAGAQRILVLGCPGAGKSTLARMLASRLGLPLFHMDDLYWQASWQRPDEDDWQRTLSEVVGGDAWIIDGNYLPWLSLRLARAESIIIVGAPSSLCLLRVIKRAMLVALGRTRDLPAAVRAEAEAGRKVSPTMDFWPLLGKILGFNRRDIVSMIGMIEAGPSRPTIMVCHGGAWGRHAVARHLPAAASARLHWRTAREFAAIAGRLAFLRTGDPLARALVGERPCHDQ